MNAMLVDVKMVTVWLPPIERLCMVAEAQKNQT